MDSPHHAGSQHATTREYKPQLRDFILICTIYEHDAPGAKPPIPEIPLNFDSRFVIGARVEKVLSGPSAWSEGQAVRFLIHSPTLMFVDQNPDKKQYRMTFSSNTSTDKATGTSNTTYVLRALSAEVISK